MKHQLQSFAYAFKGLYRAICCEGHLRFHFVAAFYVLIFSAFYDFSTTQYGVIILLIAAVIGAELVNTSVENLCDLYTRRHRSAIRIAKDVAAGAVLVISIAAAAVAAVFFLDFEVLKTIPAFFAEHIPLLALLIISAVCAFIFVWKGPKGIAAWFRKKKNK